MANGLDKLVAPGRHTRRSGRPGLRRVCVAALILLVVQYGLGIFLNLYVSVPAADAHAGFFQEIATAPMALTVHALLGLALIGAAILLVARAIGERDRLLAMLATAGLTAIGGAFGAGEIFVKNGQAGASLAMAVLTGMALLCYVGVLVIATTAERPAAGLRRETAGLRRETAGLRRETAGLRRETAGPGRPAPVRAPRPRTPATLPDLWPAGQGWPGREGPPGREGSPGGAGRPAEERWPAGY